MQTQWQLTLLWGVLVGTGTGVTSMVLAAIIANRWFDERRGLVLGVLSAANATGQLVFLPLLASLVEQRGWRAAALLVAAAAARRVRHRADLHARPAGGSRPAAVRARPADAGAPQHRALAPLAALRHGRAARARSGCSPERSSSAAPAPTA